MADINGTADGETLNGGAGDDFIQGFGGDDVINGRGGADNLQGGTGDDLLDGGDGNDILNGGAGRDVIVGGAGNDTIDTIDRGAGLFDPPEQATRDLVDAGDGDDNVTAGHFDVVDGGAGMDGLSINFNFQSTGSITLDVAGSVGVASDGTTFSNFEFVNFNFADDGNDVANTGNIRASLDGGGGNDTLTTGAADDVVFGGAGNDIIRSGAGNDTLGGGAGDDIIGGGAGDDSLSTNRGNDGFDRVDLGEGNDVVRVEDNFNIGQVRLTFTSAEVGNGSARDSNTMANQDGRFAVHFQAEDENGNLVGVESRYDDEGIQFIAGTQGIFFDVRDLVSGAQRGDIFSGVVLGTSGDDDLTFFPPFRANESFYYNGGMGADTIVAGAAADFLVGGAGDDRLEGNDGADTFIGGGGSDVILGGEGNDTSIFNVATEGADQINLGGGDDVVNVSGTAMVRLMFTSAEVGNGSSADGGTMTNQDGGLAVRLQAEDATDTLMGDVSRFDDEAITFVAAAGTTFDVRDLVSGVGRGDQFEVVSLGTSGRDVMTALQAARPYYFNAGMGDDVITGGSSNDFLVGGGGADRLDGGLGNDSFIGGGGDDVILGRAGDDTVIHDVSTAGADRVSLGAGDDVVNVSGAAQVRLTFTSAEVGNAASADGDAMTNQDGGLALRLQAEDGSDGLTGAVSRFDDEGITFVAQAGATFDVRDLVSGTARGDQFQVVTLGTEAGDTLTSALADRSYYINGGMGADNITGSDVNDFIVGGAGDDLLYGGEGYDSFLGGGGNDYINSGRGADRMEGGLGDDTYVVDNVGDVVVEMMGGGVDTIRSSITTTLADWVDQLVLIGTAQINGTGNALNNDITGNDRANVITGGGGADLLKGGDGADRFNYDAVSDSSVGSSDGILDLQSIDVIDLSDIDADTTTAGDQAFIWVDAFSGTAGEMTFIYDAGRDQTILMADVDGDGMADFRIAVVGDQSDYDNFRL